MRSTRNFQDLPYLLQYTIGRTALRLTDKSLVDRLDRPWLEPRAIGEKSSRTELEAELSAFQWELPQLIEPLAQMTL
jgi:hypothetical protein